MELDSEATDVTEQFTGNQHRGEGSKERNSSVQQAEANDHGDQANTDPTEKFGDERRAQCDADGSTSELVLGITYCGYFVGAVVDCS